MAEKDAIIAEAAKIMDRLETLEKTINERFEKLKKVVIDYLNLGSDFAKGSLITALKQV